VLNIVCLILTKSGLLSISVILILSEGKDDVMVEYAMLHDKSKLVVSQYHVYLPDIEQLKNKVREIIEK